jgi:hypothetical protein
VITISKMATSRFLPSGLIRRVVGALDGHGGSSSQHDMVKKHKQQARQTHLRMYVPIRLGSWLLSLFPFYNLLNGDSNSNSVAMPPLVTEIFTADPSAHSFKVDGKQKLFVYPSHDIEANITFNDRGDQYAMRDYRVLGMCSCLFFSLSAILPTSDQARAKLTKQSWTISAQKSPSIPWR